MDGLDERLRNHAQYFDSVLDIIPSHFYFPVEYDFSSWPAVKSLVHLDAHKSALEVQKSRAKGKTDEPAITAQLTSKPQNNTKANARINDDMKANLRAKMEQLRSKRKEPEDTIKQNNKKSKTQDEHDHPMQDPRPVNGLQNGDASKHKEKKDSNPTNGAVANGAPKKKDEKKPQPAKQPDPKQQKPKPKQPESSDDEEEDDENEDDEVSLESFEGADELAYASTDEDAEEIVDDDEDEEGVPEDEDSDEEEEEEEEDGEEEPASKKWKKAKDSDDKEKADLDLQFSTFDFSTGKPLPTYLAQKRKNPKPQAILKQLEEQQRLLEQLQGEDKIKAMQDIGWRNALAKAEGKKVKDDPQRLKKAIKTEKKRKEKSAKEWKERKEKELETIRKKQLTREKNIKERTQRKKDKRFAKKTGKKLKRPGFEGRKKNFLNK